MNQQTKRKTVRKMILKILLIALCLFILTRFCSKALFGNIPSIDEYSELLQVFHSSDGTRTVEVHLSYGSLTTCDSVICRVYGEDLRERNFFCLYHGTSAEITWLDENHIFIEATTCGNERYWKDVLPAGSTGITLDVRGEWYDNGDFGGIGRDENGKLFLHKWWRD